MRKHCYIKVDKNYHSFNVFYLDNTSIINIKPFKLAFKIALNKFPESKRLASKMRKSGFQMSIRLERSATATKIAN